jgi:predicted site-specific integrase-resolvase
MNIRISKLAKDLGVTKTTIWNWKRSSKIEFIKDKTNGFNYVSLETYNKLLNINNSKHNSEKIVYVYARVSSNDRKNGLNTQIERMVNFANINASIK